MSLAATCHWHPTRRAVGVCVETKQPMCSECSTVFRGVNLSKAGVEARLQREREAEATKRGGHARGLALAALAWAMVLPALYFLHLGWSGSAVALIRVMRSFGPGAGS